jgi:hypothetical protein
MSLVAHLLADAVEKGGPGSGPHPGNAKELTSTAVNSSGRADTLGSKAILSSGTGGGRTFGGDPELHTAAATAYKQAAVDHTNAAAAHAALGNKNQARWHTNQARDAKTQERYHSKAIKTSLRS